MKASSAVIFVSETDHHSNLLPWREITEDVVLIPTTQSGTLNREYLLSKLTEFRDRFEQVDSPSRTLKIGSFTAASNVTGILEDTEEVHYLPEDEYCFSFFNFFSSPLKDFPLVLQSESNIFFR